MPNCERRKIEDEISKRRRSETKKNGDKGGSFRGKTGWSLRWQLKQRFFFDYFANKFIPFNGVRVHTRSDRFAQLTWDDTNRLKAPFTEQEIKDAVWDCGSDRAPGSDGFIFQFLKLYWDVFSEDVLSLLHELNCRFWSYVAGLDRMTRYLVEGCGVRGLACYLEHVWRSLGLKFRILEALKMIYLDPIGSNKEPHGLLGWIMDLVGHWGTKGIKWSGGSGWKRSQSSSSTFAARPRNAVNELVSWFKKKRKRLLVFKVDFEKAYDSISWDYLDQVLQFMGFGVRWRRWIRAILVSARANPCPVPGRAKVASPLSPFLFILVMDGLHVAMEDAVASSLRINLQKSNLFGVGVDAAEVGVLADFTGCSAASFPFLYLGLPVGENMNRVKGWKPVIDRFEKRLSSWKIKMLSMGVPVTLVKYLEAVRARFLWGAEGDERKISWVRWDVVVGGLMHLELISSACWRLVSGPDDYTALGFTGPTVVLNSKENGGLDVGSLSAFNKALLYKWRWRFLNDRDVLWVRVMEKLHGSADGYSLPNKFKGVWSNIVGTINYLHDRDLIPLHSISRIVGNGSSTRFWSDGLRNLVIGPAQLLLLRRCGRGWAGVWSGEGEIRGGVLAVQVRELGEILAEARLSGNPDSWRWDFGGDGRFSVSSARRRIDGVLLPWAVSQWELCGRYSHPPQRISFSFCESIFLGTAKPLLRIRACATSTLSEFEPLRTDLSHGRSRFECFGGWFRYRGRFFALVLSIKYELDVVFVVVP
ncbi:hypothetical protein LXL04_026522 [Taraxacum kok-saghyz]